MCLCVWVHQKNWHELMLKLQSWIQCLWLFITQPFSPSVWIFIILQPQQDRFPPKKATVTLYKWGLSRRGLSSIQCLSVRHSPFISAHWSFHERTEGKWWKEAKVTLIAIKAFSISSLSFRATLQSKWRNQLFFPSFNLLLSPGWNFVPCPAH